MATTRLVFKPGIDVEKSASLNRGGWSLSNGIRFRAGLPEMYLGWTRFVATALAGIARALHYWADLAGKGRFAIGTNQKLYVVEGNALVDITPASDFVAGDASSSGALYSLLIWSLDNFGQNLIAAASGQGIFVWVPNVAGNPPATLITQAPAVNQGALVLDQIQIVLSYGCTPLIGGTRDPMLVRWCDATDYTVWTASTTNQAGSYRIPRGSHLVGAIAIPNMALLWSDIGLWTIRYIGYPLVFSFQPAGANCGLIGQKAACVLGGIAYWMSEHGYFQLSGGGPSQMPCPIWDQVYKNLDTHNQDKTIVGTDYHYSEVWWFWVSTMSGTGEVDSYAKVNIAEGEWDYGPASLGAPNAMARTAWTDQNQPGLPISIDLAGVMQQQDTGFTGDGEALVGSIRSGYIDLAEGHDLMVVSQFIPDFKWDGDNPSLSITIYFRNWPGDEPTALGPFTITPATEYVTLRLPKTLKIGDTEITAYPFPRAREIALQIDGIAGWWRLGNCRARVAPAGAV